MEEVEGPEGPAAPHRVIGTPPPTPRLLGSGQGTEDGGAADGHGAEVEPAEERLPEVSDYPSHASNAEKIVAWCFLIAFIAGCGFIAAYVGLEVGSVDATLRSNLALGFSLGRTGPVTEGLVIFLGGIGFLVLASMWLTAKRREPWDVAQEENARAARTEETARTSGTEH